ncbi:MAG: hypothetical protein JG767_641 [Deferribacteraceae bacterium]|jgi:uncharacterized protein YebE (UPF0316 family)|nr:hypothetical protein [Deferribacteraceae bacterium]
MEILLNFLFIFFSRIVDVSLGTIRIILVSKGMRTQASILGFFEVLIWIIVVAQVIKYVSSPIYYVAFAAGFASGNYIGMLLEQKIALGDVLIRVITRVEADKLVEALRKENFIITALDGEGKDGSVKVIFGVIKRKSAKKFIQIVNKYNPNAFYSVENVSEVSKYENDPLLNRKFYFGNFKRK